jgi:AraC family transcriptional regulator
LPNLANVDYVARVNRAIDHVTRNLAEPLNLEDVAKVACFSSFHFHRIFKTLTGETLAQFIKRARLERAVFLLSHRPKTTLTEVALACGFSSSSDFSRSFRSYYGVAPRMFDVALYRNRRRQALHMERLPRGENPDGFTVRLRDVPPRRVAYLRVHRPYEGGVEPAAARMLAWARERGLEGGQWLGYQWDDPEIVPLELCRYDIGLEIPASVDVDGEVSATTFPAMKLAEVDIAGAVDLELRALDWLYGTWLPTSGWAPDHQPGFEAFNGLPFAHGTTHFELRVQIAVVDAAKPL